MTKSFRKYRSWKILGLKYGTEVIYQMRSASHLVYLSGDGITDKELLCSGIPHSVILVSGCSDGSVTTSYQLLVSLHYLSTGYGEPWQ